MLNVEDVEAVPYEDVTPKFTTESAFTFVVQEIVAVVWVVEVAILEITGPGLETRNETGEEVAKLSDVSRATATTVFKDDEVAVESQVAVYGEEVISLPICTPSI